MSKQLGLPEYPEHKKNPLDITSLGDAFQVEINYDMPLKQRIKWARFHHVDSELDRDVSSLVPNEGRQTKIARFFHLTNFPEEYIPVQYPIHLMNTHGYNAGGLQELCVLATIFPYISLYFPVMGMNSFWVEGPLLHVPALDSCIYSWKRQLTVFRASMEGDIFWPKHCRFLGVRTPR